MLQFAQYAKFSIDASEPCDDAGDDGQQLVGHFEIIHMPGYRHFVPTDCPVGHTGVIGVYLKALGIEVSPQFLAEHEHWLK